MFLSINGTSFDVLGVIKVGRGFDVQEDANAGKAITGRRIRSIVGTYLSHSFSVYRDPSNVADFDAFWDFLVQHSVDESVMLEAADGQTTVSYEAVYTAAKQDLEWRNNDTNLWGRIDITFSSIEPQVVPE